MLATQTPTDQPSTEAAAGPVIAHDGVTFLVPAAALPDGVSAVGFGVDWDVATSTDFTEQDGIWTLHLPRPAAHRIEYQLVLTHPDGGEQFVTDPTNPSTVPGPFGNKSEILFPDYAPPSWLSHSYDGDLVDVVDPPSDLAVPVPIRVFSPTGLAAETPAPLLLAHDGSDLADRGDLLRWAAAQPEPVRVALLDPPSGLRDDWYAANPDYADHLATSIIPALSSAVATTGVVGLGVSLGAVAMMTIHRRHPEALAGMALQSGSFFTTELDPQESGWGPFAKVCSAVAEFASALPGQVRPIPVLMTVGAIEENRLNNEQMAGTLSFLGYPVDARIVADAHTVICWRDAWSPGLDELVAGIAADG